MRYAIIRNNRIGCQLPEATNHGKMSVTLPWIDLQSCFCSDKFVYPITTGGISYKTFIDKTILELPFPFELNAYCFLTVDVLSNVRLEVFQVGEGENNKDFYYQIMDYDVTHPLGHIVGETSGSRDNLMGILATKASEDLINQKVVEHVLGTARPFVWFDIQNIVDGLKAKLS